MVVDLSRDGYPDGCAIDADDKIWVAMWGGGQVVRYDPISGEAMLRVPLPNVMQVTSCAFGGDNLDQLFVTTASCGLSDAQLAEQTNAGALFRVDLSATGIKGCVAPMFG